MVLNIKKNATLQEIKEAFKRISRRKKKSIDLDHYFGKVDFKMDGLAYQKKVRDEWT